MNATTKILKAVTLSVSLLGSAAIVGAFAMPDAAYANGGNGGGKGNGGGNGNGGQGGNSNKSESKKSSAKQSKQEASEKVKFKDILAEYGVTSSDLGALNALHASPNAFLNASENSRVGRIAAYREAVIEGQALEDQLATKELALEALTPPARSSGDIMDEIALLDPVADAEAIGILNTELTAAQTYEALDAEVDILAGQVATQTAEQRALLEDAANKPVTDDIEAAVKALLGL